MKGVKSTSAPTPFSSAGIMRFFDVGGGGPQIKPEVVLVGVLLFVFTIAFLKMAF